MTRSPRTGAVVGLLVTLCASTAFGLYLAAQEVTDPFLYYDAAFVARTLHQPRMAFPATGPFASLRFAPGRIMLMLQLAAMTGIPAERLQFVPWGAMLISQTLYVLALRLLKSPALAVLVTLYLTLNLSHAAALYSTFAYAMAVPLYTGLLIISARLFQGDRQIAQPLSLLLFCAAHVTHYTMTAWIVVFMVGANLTIALQRRRTPGAGRCAQTTAPYLTLTFIVLYLAFNRAIYASFLPMIKMETLEGAVLRFSSYLSLAPTQPALYAYRRPAPVSLISALTLVVIMAPALAGLLRDGWQMIARHCPIRPVELRRPLIWGITAAGFADGLAYTVRGVISTKSYAMFFPLIALFYAQRLRKATLTYGLAALLLGLTLVKIVVFYQASSVIGPERLKTNLAEVQVSARWLHDHGPETGYTIAADLNLYGKYLLAATTPIPVLQGYTQALFAQTIGAPAAPPAAPDLLAIDLASAEPVTGFVWRQYPPFRHYQAAIQANRSLSLIYDDGLIWLGAPTKE